ncbi:MAG: TonB-dependent receptor, partial [Myxococcota bacterium]|nr:TonB-dependent receptor [Myxococcota bacterium]
VAPVATPPRLIESPDPEYPGTHDAIGIEPVVHLHVTVETDGSVGEVHVEHPGDPEFDHAAIAAVERWRFAPAMQGETPVRSRVRLAVRFHAPDPAVRVTEPDPHGHDPHAHDPHDDDPHDRAEPEPRRLPPPEPVAEAAPEADTTAHFEARAVSDPLRESRRPRAASDYEIRRDILEAAPHRDAADLLSSAPGVYVARPEGEAVAPHVFLRGFDAEHGQDIEMTSGGVPLNLPSHVHGQGYADLGFLIPEVVRGLRVTEGVYDPRQGDFATAGSIDFDLGVARRGIQLRTSYGSFDTFRALILWAPEGEREETFGAATYRSTSGFGRNRAGQSGGAIAQYVFGSDSLRGRVQASIWAARTAVAGILRRDDVAQGRVDFYGVYDEPTALAQSALAARAHLAGSIESRGARGSFGEIGAWLQWHDFRLQANYTGYTERSQFNPDWVGRGDLIEQRNEVLALGLRARYRSELYEPFEWLRGFVEVGLTGRVDVIGQQQNLIETPQNQTWDRRVDADIRAIDIGGYFDLDWCITDYVHVRGGARADVLFYDVDDRLSNFIPSFRRETYIIGYRRSAMGVAAGPRVALEVTPLGRDDDLVLSVAYGEGYRSPQARQLQDGESAPFAKVRSGDVGARLHLGDHDELRIHASGYLTSVGDDTAFDPREGRLERLGPTTRIGGALYVEARPWSFLTGAVSFTYVHATLDAPPPPSIADPSPPYEPGQALPYVPPVVVRADLSVGERLFDVLDQPLSGRLGVGVSFLSSRPLPYGLAADPVGLVDVSASVRWSALELSVEIFNLFDNRYAAVEYSYASTWSRDAIPSRVPARHFAAGAPLTVNVSLGVTL